MKSKVSLSLALLFALVLPRVALANDQGWYASLTGSHVFLPRVYTTSPISYVKNVYDNGLGVSGALGYAIGNGVRLEGEIGYNKNAANSMYVFGPDVLLQATGWKKDWTGLINAYYDFNTSTKWTPYIGAGVGLSKTYMKTNLIGIGLVVDDDNVMPVAQLSAGVSYSVTQKVSAFVGYRYVMTRDFSLTSTPASGSGHLLNEEHGSHRAQLGLRVRF